MSTIKEIAVKEITLGDNARVINIKKLKQSELFQSIKQFGVRIPITVVESNNSFKLISGFRRYNCAKEIGVEKIACHVVETSEITDQDEALHNFLENAHREDLSPIEQGKAAVMLKEKLGDLKMTALALGISLSTLGKRMALTNLSKKWQDRINDPENAPVSLALLDLVAPFDEDVQDKLLGRCMYGLDIEGVKKAIEEILCEIKKAKFDAEKEGCLACNCNSARSALLFPEYEKSPRCTKPECFKQKQKKAFQELFNSFAAKNPEGVVLVEYGSGSDEYMEDFDVKFHSCYKTYDVEKAKKDQNGAVKAFNPFTGVVSSVVIPKESKAKKNAGPKSMDDKKESLHLRRVNCVREQVIKILKEKNPADFMDDVQILQLASCFGSVRKRDFCNPKEWDGLHAMTDRQAFVTLGSDVRDVLIARLHANSASQQPAGMEEELEICSKWFKIDWEPLWKKAVEEHPVPKSWTKKGETSQKSKK